MAVFGLPMGGELWIILIIVLILFGPSQLPKLAKMVGKSAKALKEGMETGLDEGDEEKKLESAESEKKDTSSTE